MNQHEPKRILTLTQLGLLIGVSFLLLGLFYNTHISSGVHDILVLLLGPSAFSAMVGYIMLHQKKGLKQAVFSLPISVILLLIIWSLVAITLVFFPGCRFDSNDEWYESKKKELEERMLKQNQQIQQRKETSD